MKTGVYKILNTFNKKLYVGSSAKSLENRKIRHFKNLSKNCHVNKHLQYSYNKYGAKNFEFIILEFCLPENCISKEQYYIDLLNPEYNKAPKAGSCLGVKHSEEVRKKNSLRNIGKKLSDEVKKKISISHKGINTWMKGRKLTLQHKKNISRGNLGKHTGPTGRPAWNKGIPFSIET